MKLFHWNLSLLLGPALLLAVLTVSLGCAPDSETESDTETASEINLITEVACGQCQFGMDGEGCDLAIRLGGREFWVDGTTIDDHGDAHGPDGLCNCVRKAKIRGTIINGRFQATEFKLLPQGGDSL